MITLQNGGAVVTLEWVVSKLYTSDTIPYISNLKVVKVTPIVENKLLA